MNSEIALDDAAELIANLLDLSDLKRPGNVSRELRRMVPENFEPGDTYVTQFSPDRLYTMSPDMLLNQPQDLFGANVEGMILLPDGDGAWVGIRKIKRLPRELIAAKSGLTLYEFHHRIPRKNEYSIDWFGLDAKGRVVEVNLASSKPNVFRSRDWSAYANQVILVASLIEDAHRPGTLLARFSDGKSIKTPVPIDEHRELFALRDAPLTRAGKRKAIIHWVASHTRQTLKRESEVVAHWRGARALEIEGMLVTLTPN